MRITAAIFMICFTLFGCVSQSSNNRFSNGDFDAQDAAKTRVSLGLTYLKNGNFTQAKKNLDMALQYAPSLPDVHYGLGYYYQLVEETARAESSYKKALQLAPNNADIANSYGAFLCQLGRLDDAKVYFDKAINNPQYANTAETYENMALCAQSEARFDEAETYLESALNHQPGRSKSLLLLVELHLAQKQWDKASDAMKRYQKTGKITPDILWKSVQIAEGQGDIMTARGYGDMLVSMYPNHPITKQYMAHEEPLPVVSVTRKAKVAESAQSEAQNSEPAPSVTHGQEVTKTTSDAEQGEAQNDRRFHIVNATENLYRLSLKYNIKLDTLREWNNLSSTSVIKVGQKIWLVPPEQQSK